MISGFKLSDMEPRCVFLHALDQPRVRSISIRRTPRVRGAHEAPADGWNDSRGTLTWTTLFNAGPSTTECLPAAAAVLEPGGFVAPHRHPPTEIYYSLDGARHMTIDGDGRAVTAGTGIFIPGNAEHGIRNGGTATLRFLYAFAVDRFEDVEYAFS
jgi:quercetin dioxygenase-like cupin family protein